MLNLDGLTYEAGPDPVVWFPWEKPGSPPLGPVKVRWARLANGGIIKSDWTLADYIPEMDHAYWVGVSAKDGATLEEMASMTSTPVDGQKVLKLKSNAAMVKNKMTPNPSRPEEPDTFWEEVNKLTPVTDHEARAKADYMTLRDTIKQLVRNAALTGARNVSWRMLNAPDSIPYAQAFEKAMAEDQFTNFEVFTHVAGDEFGVTVEVRW